jgi:hypothetical protein
VRSTEHKAPCYAVFTLQRHTSNLCGGQESNLEHSYPNDIINTATKLVGSIAKASAADSIGVHFETRPRHKHKLWLRLSWLSLVSSARSGNTDPLSSINIKKRCSCYKVIVSLNSSELIAFRLCSVETWASAIKFQGTPKFISFILRLANIIITVITAFLFSSLF